MVLVKYLKHYMPYAKGDIRQLTDQDFEKLFRLKIVEKVSSVNQQSADIYIEPLTGNNLLNIAYIKGKIDIVIPTISQDKVNTPKNKIINSGSSYNWDINYGFTIPLTSIHLNLKDYESKSEVTEIFLIDILLLSSLTGLILLIIRKFRKYKVLR